MKYLVNFFVIIFFSFYSNIASSNEKIVYINMSQILNKSIAGNFIINEIEKIHKANIVEFKKIEKNLQDIEKNILAQKNILSDDEYKKKITSLKTQINNYNSKKNKKINELKQKRINAQNELLSNLQLILTKYSTDNNISYILNKKNVVVAKKSLDITKDIIDLLNQKLKKIKIN
tara:strand:+ start:1029 stop:1553 length:525 start_codon:yes stop_codon:yes gene_type:complete